MLHYERHGKNKDWDLEAGVLHHLVPIISWSGKFTWSLPSTLLFFLFSFSLSLFLFFLFYFFALLSCPLHEDVQRATFDEWCSSTGELSDTAGRERERERRNGVLSGRGTEVVGWGGSHGLHPRENQKIEARDAPGLTPTSRPWKKERLQTSRSDSPGVWMYDLPSRACFPSLSLSLPLLLLFPLSSTFCLRWPSARRDETLAEIWEQHEPSTHSWMQRSVSEWVRERERERWIEEEARLTCDEENTNLQMISHTGPVIRPCRRLKNKRQIRLALVSILFFNVLSIRANPYFLLITLLFSSLVLFSLSPLFKSSVQSCTFLFLLLLLLYWPRFLLLSFLSSSFRLPSFTCDCISLHSHPIVGQTAG